MSFGGRYILLWLMLLASVARAEQPMVVVEQVLTNPPLAELDEPTANAIEFPTNQPITRSELQSQIDACLQRLNSLSTYSMVDLQLQKGSQRNHFVIAIDLTMRSPLYSGFFLRRTANKEEIDSHSDFGIFLFGSRDTADTGLVSEVSLAKIHTTYEPEGSRLVARRQSAQLTIADPQIGNSPWFAGSSVLYVDQRAFQNYQFEDEDVASDDHGISKSVLVAVGRRFGLLSLTGSMTRATNSTRFSDSASTGQWQYWHTELGLAAKYSDKTFLASVEPGVVIEASFERTAAPEWNYSYARWSALYTFLFDQGHALTPRGASSVFWSPVVSSEGDYTVMSRSYDASLKYQYMLSDSWYLGLVGGRFFPWDGAKLYGDRYENRLGISLTRQTPHLIIDLSLRYGRGGLEDGLWDKANLDSTRFAK